MLTKTTITLLFLLFRSAACLAGRVVVSTNKNGGHSMTYFLSDGKVKTASSSSGGSGLLSTIRSVFLPAGFPQSAPSGYLLFASFNALQDLSTQLRGILATQRILEGVGVGRADATAASAVINFLVRDGCGMVATLLFTAGAAASFAGDVKRWRLFADIMVDVGITLEVAATQVPNQLFLPLICLGNMCKAVCGVAAGACGGAINVHWSSQGTDIADIQAKFGAQHTVTASIGLIVAALTARTMGRIPTRQLWLWFVLLTALHIWANRQCMRLMAFAGLNTVRMQMILGEYFQKLPLPKNRDISTPSQMAMKEPLLFLPSRHPLTIDFGVSFNQVVQKSGRSEDSLREAIQSNIGQSYWVFVTAPAKEGPCKKVMVVLKNGISATEQAKAYFHATVLGQKLSQQGALSVDQISLLEGKISQEMDSRWEMFTEESGRAGWDLSKTELRTKGYEIEIR